MAVAEEGARHFNERAEGGVMVRRCAAWHRGPVPLATVAICETAILLHPPPPSVGVSTWTERGCQQNNSLAGG